MDLEGLSVGVVAVQELRGDVRFSGRSHQGRNPVLRREDAVHFGLRLHDIGPADDRGHAIAALPVRVLLASERRRAAVRPGERLGAVVGRVDDDGVFGDAEVVELLQKLPDLPVMLDHAVGIGAKPRHALRFGLEVGENMHPGRIEPDEERLLGVMRPVHEIERSAEEFLVRRLHALFRQGAGVLAFLLAPRPKARIVAGSLGVGRDAFHHAARAEARLEFRVLRIVRVLRLFLGVEVIEVAEELVEAVHGRQEFVAVA